MTTVLRVEHPKWKRGPYIKTANTKKSIKDDVLLTAYSKMRDNHDNDCACHPTPDNDGLIYVGNDESCGFKDEEQLCEWFTDDDLIMLMDIGFEIIEIPAKEIRYGNKQVVFKKVGE